MATRYTIRQINKSRGNRTWYGCTYRDGCSPEQVSLHTTSKQVAQAWLRKMESAEMVPPLIRRAEMDIPLEKAESEYLAYIRLAHKPITYVTYSYRLRPCWEFLAKNKVDSLRKITPVVLTQLVESFTEDRRKTLRERFKSLRAWMAWCVDHYELLDFAPWRKVKLRPLPPQEEKEFWTVAQLEAILAAAPTPLYRLFLGFMVYSGLRYREALTMRWEDISPDLSYFTLVGKMDKFAKMPIAAKLRTLIESVRQDGVSGRIFPPSVMPQTSCELIPILKVVVMTAGLKAPGRIGYHKIRHSFATNLLRSGIDVRTVSQAMRHAQVSTTLDIYCHTTEKSVVDAVNSI